MGPYQKSDHCVRTNHRSQQSIPASQLPSLCTFGGSGGESGMFIYTVRPHRFRTPQFRTFTENTPPKHHTSRHIMQSSPPPAPNHPTPQCSYKSIRNSKGAFPAEGRVGGGGVGGLSLAPTKGIQPPSGRRSLARRSLHLNTSNYGQDAEMPDDDDDAGVRLL